MFVDKTNICDTVEHIKNDISSKQRRANGFFLNQTHKIYKYLIYVNIQLKNKFDVVRKREFGEYIPILS